MTLVQRKIIQQSATSIGISLPSKWAAKWELKKGDLLEVQERGKQLILSASGRTEPMRTELDIRALGPITKRTFDALYKKGYDEVTLVYDTQEQLIPIIESVGNEAKSFEIVKNTEGRCVVRSISELHQGEFDDLLHRTVQLLAEMATTVADALAENNVTALQSAVLLEQTNNRFTHVLRRSLNRLEYSYASNALVLYTIVESLEKAADELKYLCADVQGKLHRETALFAKESAKFVEEFVLLFLQFSQVRAAAFSVMFKNIDSKGLVLLSKGKDASAVHRLLSLTRILYDLLGPLIALRC
jgi:phosphate uptake regulator